MDNQSNQDGKMSINDVRNVLYSKEFWGAQKSYVGAKRNTDWAMREASYNLNRATTIGHDVKKKYGVFSNEQFPSTTKHSSIFSSENKR